MISRREVEGSSEEQRERTCKREAGEDSDLAEQRDCRPVKNRALSILEQASKSQGCWS